MTEQPNNPILDAALLYAASGLHVIPIWWVAGGDCGCRNAECQSQGKHPVGHLAPNGVKDATTDPNIIRSWWNRCPRANVAIATGAVSGLWALDIDGQAGEETLAELQRAHGPLPHTAQQRTGKGRHLLFEHPGHRVKNRVQDIGPGIDVRGDGGYVVAAPSQHQSGATYLWSEGIDPND